MKEADSTNKTCIFKKNFSQLNVEGNLIFFLYFAYLSLTSVLYAQRLNLAEGLIVRNLCLYHLHFDRNTENKRLNAQIRRPFRNTEMHLVVVPGFGCPFYLFGYESLWWEFTPWNLHIAYPKIFHIYSTLECLFWYKIRQSFVSEKLGFHILNFKLQKLLLNFTFHWRPQLIQFLYQHVCGANYKKRHRIFLPPKILSILSPGILKFCQSFFSKKEFVLKYVSLNWFSHVLVFIS